MSIFLKVVWSTLWGLVANGPPTDESGPPCSGPGVKSRGRSRRQRCRRNCPTTDAPKERAERHEIWMKPMRPSELVAAVERCIAKAGRPIS
jgi:hypothetical protein